MNPSIRIDPRARLGLVSSKEVLLLVDEKVPRVSLQIDFRIVDSGRDDAAFLEIERRVNQTPPRLDHHHVTMAKVLVVMIDDGAHALGDPLILHVDAIDAGEAAGALYLAINPVVVGVVLREPPATVPVGGVRLKLHPERISGRNLTVAQLTRRRGVSLPGQMNEHRMRIVHRNPRAHDEMLVEVTLRRIVQNGNANGAKRQ